MTNTDSESEAPIKKVDDPTLPKGEEKQLEAGRKGYTVSTYRIYKDNNGNVLKKEKVYVSYYPKKQGIIAVGTMEAPIVEEETTPVENTPSEDVVPPNNVEVNPEQETEAIFEESPISNT